MKLHHNLLLTLIGLVMNLSSVTSLSAQTDPDFPNIVFMIADDLGVDYVKGYHDSNLLPNTPTLDSIRAQGITFENSFSTPMCTSSRATIMSGKHGIKTGVLSPPGNLDLDHKSIFKALEELTDNTYSDAVIGKWHISQPSNPLHPSEHSIDYYTGLLDASVEDYYSWQKTENGVTTTENTYVTQYLTDQAIDWIENQDQPWFCWFAHAAPHSPLHVPPSELFTIDNTSNNKRKYVAMIESIDYELNRLLNSIPQDVKDNTIFIFIGDNGTPANLVQDYPEGHGKSTLYQGGIRVPMIVSGAGVTRKGERESALVHINDIYATILDIAGADLPGGIYNSLSFAHLLNGEAGDTRIYNYTDFEEGNTPTFAIRNERYKLIDYQNGLQEFFDLEEDSLEFNNLLLTSLSSEELLIKADLETEANIRRTDWSCNDHIQNGDETGIDCGGSNCLSCVNSATDSNSEAKIDIYPNPSYEVLNVNSEVNIKKVRLFSITGQLIKTFTIWDNKVEIDLSGIVSQELILEIQLEDGLVRKQFFKL
jgi:arylsulfatase A-like enzyme